MMDRKPLPPPFAKGKRVRYKGTRELYAVAPDETRVPLLEAGLVVTVTETQPGYQGTLRETGDWDDEEGPMLDTTCDGYSVYEVAVPGRDPVGRIIWPKDAGEWERI